MEFAGIYIALAVIFGLYMTWGVGANDVANAMGTSVGSGAISVRKAMVIAAIFEFAGAVLAGGHVTSTIRKGIIDAAFVPSPEMLVLGMLSALLAAGLWLMVASWAGWPVSTTHTIVGALVGFGAVGLGFEAVAWKKVGGIAASWVVSPLLGAFIAYLMALSVHRLILEAPSPLAAARRWGPVYVFFMGVLLSLVILLKGLHQIDLELSPWQILVVAVVIGLVVAGVGKVLIQKVRADPAAEKTFHYASVEKVFAPLCIFTACAMAFAHGSNDVANGVGPMAAVLSIVHSGEISQNSPLPFWILVLGGGGIVLGLATLGYKVMRTIGERITELTPSRGFCAELSAAATVVLASYLGLPVSTTHIIVGAVLGVGLARGIAAIDMRVLLGIVISWLITLPIGAATAAAIFYLFRAVFL
ncbi:MAG: inorganic phosphate transporter [Thermoanaerobaculia bacterium]|nr:inorganic phosphate transporter [Thermoanaerobaculia bacterium]